MFFFRKNQPPPAAEVAAYILKNHSTGKMSREPKFTDSDFFDRFRSLRAMDRFRADGTTPETGLDAGFVSRLLELIDRKQLRDSAVYKAAGLDRRLFSKMVSDPEYHPSKDTCVALALALHLTQEEEEDLLRRAGYVLSHSSKRDVALEYFFVRGYYDLQEINELLFALELKPLGG